MGPEFRRFPFFYEQKADPCYFKVRGGIFSASITRLRVAMAACLSAGRPKKIYLGC